MLFFPEVEGYILKKQKSGLKVKCPQCQKLMKYDTANSWRPFCSERCKTLDLANWAEEKYRISEALDQTEEAPSFEKKMLGDD